MKKFISGGIAVVALVITVVISAPLVSAQETTTTTTTTTSTNQSKRCTIAQGRLNLRIAKLDTVKTTQLATYTKIQEKIDTVFTSAQTAGYDITQINAARIAVQEQVTAYTASSSAYAAALMATKNLSCGDSDGAFATSLTAARAALLKVRTDAVAVRTAVSQQAIPAIEDYATWIMTQNSTKETK